MNMFALLRRLWIFHMMTICWRFIFISCRETTWYFVKLMRSKIWYQRHNELAKVHWCILIHKHTIINIVNSKLHEIESMCSQLLSLDSKISYLHLIIYRYTYWNRYGVNVTSTLFHGWRHIQNVLVHWKQYIRSITHIKFSLSYTRCVFISLNYCFQKDD